MRKRVKVQGKVDGIPGAADPPVAKRRDIPLVKGDKRKKKSKCAYASFFAPKPVNIFPAHIQEYFERSREACPHLEAITGKWEFEDLIPGLSDFDARFIFSDDTAAGDWPEISRAIGRVHAAICREYPDRARILEHLPGINLTWGELLDPLFYYPEFHQWTTYSAPAEKATGFAQYLAERPWGESDELYSMKRFATYFTPYDRAIDPAINLHEFESKYPLHSRFMHYFCPPVQSLVSLKLKRMVRGKLEAFRLARELFPNPEVIDLTFDAIDRHYEIPDYYGEPHLSRLEDLLFRYLREAFRVTCPDITVLDAAPEDTHRELRAKLARYGKNTLEQFFDGSKFCRLMAGRIFFYAEDIPHFDSAWLIRHELGRDRKMFYETTFSAFAKIAWGEDLSPEESLARCRGEFLSDDETKIVRAYADIFGRGYDPLRIKEFAVEVAKALGEYQVVLEKLGRVGRGLVMERGE
ncbi:MAG: hypothetical protein ACYC9O_07550 [Candidatus Latescibacterota bacterium]